MAAHRIESSRNPFVKSLVRLRDKRERERTGLFLIEGARELERALTAGVAFERVALAPELVGANGRDFASRLAGGGTEIVELAAEAFRKASMRQNPDGYLAVARTWRTPPADLPLSARPLLLVAHGLEKPGNLGALLRSADAVAADAVVVTGQTTDVFNPNVVRASMGSLFSRPVAGCSAGELFEWIAGAGLRLVVTSPHARKPYWHADLTEGVVVAVGPEDRGLDSTWLEHAHEAVHIPMLGSADSLNVATAGALVLYEALRQRRDAP